MAFQSNRRSLSFLALAVHATQSLCWLAAGLAVLSSLLPAHRLSAQDWPQLLGPTRDGVSPAPVDFAEAWPAQLAPKWATAVGSGFAAPLVVGQQVLLFQRQDNQELLVAYSLESGERLWQVGWPSNFRPSINYDDGPRSTPAVSGDLAVCFGASGDAACVNIQDGSLVWHRPLRKELQANDGYFGAGSSPLIVDDIVILCPGARRTNAGIVALDLKTGKTRWQATDFEASYASPIAIRVGGKQLVLAVMRLNTVLLEAATGKVLGDVNFGSRGPTVNAATPIAIGKDRYWLTANYGVGTTIVAASTSGLRQQFASSPLLAAQYNSPVVSGGRLFGIDGYEDRGNVSLRAIDLASNMLVWQQDDFGTAHILAVGNQLLVLSLNGKLQVIDPAANRFTELSQTSLPAQGYIYRATPAISGNRLIVRNSSMDFGGGAKLMRFDLP